MAGISEYFASADLASDPDRLHVLYSPFRDKTVNPKGYESKLKTWQDAIFRYMRMNNSVFVDSDELIRAFTIDDKKPSCLEEVLRELTASTKLLAENDFRARLQSNQKGWIPWAVGLGFDYLVKKPVSMSFNWAWNSVVGASKPRTEGVFVCQEMVEELSTKLNSFCCDEGLGEKHLSAQNESFSALSNNKDTYELDYLRKETKSIVGNDKTLNIALAFLQSKGKVTITTLNVGDQEKTFVCFGSSENFSAENQFPLTLGASPLRANVREQQQSRKLELSEKDKTLIQLRSTEKELIRQIEIIHAEMEKLRCAAKQYLAKGIRTLALNSLKRKKLLQSKLDEREKALDNIEVMISKLEDVDSTKMIISAYKDAAAALNKSLSEADIDSVEETMDDLKEALDKQAELQATLAAGPLRGEEEEDDDELESELEAILNGDENENSLELPKVPTNELPNLNQESVEDLLDKLCISPVKTGSEKRQEILF